MENVENNLNVDENNGNQTDPMAPKLFTQEEVNEIIKKRLERTKTKSGEDDPEQKADLQVRETELNNKEIELGKRETEINCKSFLVDNGLPLVYLEVLDTLDLEKFKENVSKLNEIRKKDTMPFGLAEPPAGGEVTGDLLGRPKKHRPKGKIYDPTED